MTMPMPMAIAATVAVDAAYLGILILGYLAWLRHARRRLERRMAGLISVAIYDSSGYQMACGTLPETDASDLIARMGSMKT